MNDRDTLWKSGADGDPYAVFARMLGSGNPPNEWMALALSAAALVAEHRPDPPGDGA